MKCKDFDAMFPEASDYDSQGHIKIFGKYYHFSKELPALYMLRYMRGVKVTDPKFWVDMAVAIYGEDAVEEISMHKGFSFRMLREMVDYAFKVINGNDDDAETEVTEDDFGHSKKRKN